MLYMLLDCSVRGVNAYLKTQQCVATTIWYSYFSYTILSLSYGLQLGEHWLSIHPEKGWLLRCLGLILAGSVNARVQYACACC